MLRRLAFAIGVVLACAVPALANGNDVLCDVATEVRDWNQAASVCPPAVEEILAERDAHALAGVLTDLDRSVLTYNAGVCSLYAMAAFDLRSPAALNDAFVARFYAQRTLSLVAEADVPAAPDEVRRGIDLTRQIVKSRYPEAVVDVQPVAP
jgi:hypothetical protein